MEACVPMKFQAIWDAWKEHNEALTRERWEQTRFTAWAMLQPYSKKRLRPRDVMEFEWDKSSTESDNRRLSQEERGKEMEAILSRYGLCYDSKSQ